MVSVDLTKEKTHLRVITDVRLNFKVHVDYDGKQQKVQINKDCSDEGVPL